MKILDTYILRYNNNYDGKEIEKIFTFSDKNNFIPFNLLLAMGIHHLKTKHI